MADLKLCPAHLYIRFCTADFLEGSTVLIGTHDEEGGCIDCDAYHAGKMSELANPDPIMDRWLLNV